LVRAGELTECDSEGTAPSAAVRDAREAVGDVDPERAGAGAGGGCDGAACGAYMDVDRLVGDKVAWLA
jgi:hypothetical protein